MTPVMIGSGILLTSDDLLRWKREVSELEAKVETLRARKDLLARRIEVAEALSMLLDAPRDNAEHSLVTPDQTAAEESPLDNSEIDVGEEVIEGEWTWVSVVHDAIYGHAMGVASHDLREEFAQSPFYGPRMEVSDKGYYNAVSRLAERKQIVKHNGRLFSPEAHAAYQAAVARGEIIDRPPVQPNAYSPMGAAIEQAVMDDPGVTSAEIIRRLKRDPEFAATLHPKATVAYNIIARLKKRRRIEARGKGLFLSAALAESPEHPLPRNTEPPGAHAPRGSGVVGSSPNGLSDFFHGFNAEHSRGGT